MNDFSEQQPDAENERLLAEAIAALKRIEPPAETRLANRQAVAAALDQLGAMNLTVHQPWWLRSISVPLPLAAAIGLLIAVLTFASIRPGENQVREVATTRALPSTEVKVQPKQPAATRKSKTDSPAKWKRYQSEVYLCGVGPLSSETYYGTTEVESYE